MPVVLVTGSSMAPVSNPNPDFVKQVAAKFPDRSAQLVLYGSSLDLRPKEKVEGAFVSKVSEERGEGNNGRGTRKMRSSSSLPPQSTLALRASPSALPPSSAFSPPFSLPPPHPRPWPLLPEPTWSPRRQPCCRRRATPSCGSCKADTLRGTWFTGQMGGGGRRASSLTLAAAVSGGGGRKDYLLEGERAGGKSRLD
jgi:hypothetical protein